MVAGAGDPTGGVGGLTPESAPSGPGSVSTPGVAAATRRAAMNSPHVAYRSPGSLAIALDSTSSTAGGTRTCPALSTGGGAYWCANRSTSTPSPSNGG
jgi:hypothetical protein